MKEIWGQDEKIRSVLKKQKLNSVDQYRLSQFVLTFELYGKTCLYNTMTRQCLLTDCTLSKDSSFSFTRIIGDSELYKLAEDYFLVPEQKDEVDFYKSIYQLMRTIAKKKGFAGYMILPTLGCNARCVYCYEKNRPRRSMTMETVDRIIEYILETRRKNTRIHFSWFGGEPLLRTDVIDTICMAMAENGIEFKSSIVTNGSLINDELVSKMIEDWHIEEVQVSMDCAEEDYIARKKYYQYENTYWNVMKNAEKLACRGAAVGIRCNVDEGNIERIPDFLSDLGNVIKEKSKILIYFAPLHGFRESPAFLSYWNRIIESRTLIERAGFRNVTTSSLKSFQVNNCMADQPSGYAVIAPGGELYTCLHCEPGTSHGDIFRGTTRPDILRSFIEVGDVREKCRDCPILPECTPFSRCPNRNDYCKITRTESNIYILRQMVKEQVESACQPLKTR